MRAFLKTATALTAAGVCVALFSQPVSAARSESATASAVPVGVTVTPPQAAGRRGGKAVPGILSNADGKTLYTFDADDEAGKATCLAACATAWPPLTAPPRAVLSSEWTVTARADGVKQWAYRGHPLYRSAKDTKAGETAGDGADSKWHVAYYDPSPSSVAAPAGIGVKQSGLGSGDIFVDYRGMTLYMAANNRPCDETCRKTWAPLPAGGLAKTVGDWTITDREDGSRQWAYRGKLVYTFTGDGRAGDVNGVHFDENWQTVALREYFTPPQVKMRKSGSLVVFTTTDGLTLYARDKYQYAPGSFHADDGSSSNVGYGREVGTEGCAGGCGPEWVPLKAAPNSQPSGFWTILTRADGTRQWAYQGYAIYANSKDKKPGEMMGRDMFDFTDGSHAMFWRVATP